MAGLGTLCRARPPSRALEAWASRPFIVKLASGNLSSSQVESSVHQGGTLLPPEAERQGEGRAASTPRPTLERREGRGDPEAHLAVPSSAKAHQIRPEKSHT